MRCSQPRGLTLAEVMVSVGLLAVVILTVIGVMTGGLRLLSRSQEMTDAAHAARQMVERIREQGGYAFVPENAAVFDGSLPRPAKAGFPPDPYPTCVLNGREYTFRVECKPGSSNVRSVLVQVFWAEGGRIELETAFHASGSG